MKEFLVKDFLKDRDRVRSMDNEISYKAQSIGRDLSNLLNYSRDGYTSIILVEAIAEGMHRSLQQKFWREMRDVAAYYSSLPDYYFDARNEASKEFAAKMAEAVKDEYLPLI